MEFILIHFTKLAFFFQVEYRLVIAQLAIQEKTNEAATIPALMDLIEMEASAGREYIPDVIDDVCDNLETGFRMIFQPIPLTPHIDFSLEMSYHYFSNAMR